MNKANNIYKLIGEIGNLVEKSNKYKIALNKLTVKSEKRIGDITMNEILDMSEKARKEVETE